MCVSLGFLNLDTVQYIYAFLQYSKLGLFRAHTWDFETELALTADVSDVRRLAVTRDSLGHSGGRFAAHRHIEGRT